MSVVVDTDGSGVYVGRGYVATLCVCVCVCVCVCICSDGRIVHTLCDWLMGVPPTHLLPLAGEALNHLP